MGRAHQSAFVSVATDSNARADLRSFLVPIAQDFHFLKIRDRSAQNAYR